MIIIDFRSMVSSKSNTRQPLRALGMHRMQWIGVQNFPPCVLPLSRFGKPRYAAGALYGNSA